MNMNPYHTEGALADAGDHLYIRDLNRKFTWELGWLVDRALAVRVATNTVLLARCNGDRAGFLLHGVFRERIRIFQHCIQLDARHKLHGLRLLSGLVVLAGLANVQLISLHCRDGLESNAFWAKCGFHLGQIVPGGHTAGRVLCEWHLNVPAAILNPDFPHGYAYVATCIALRDRANRDGRLLRQGQGPQIFNRDYHNLAIKTAVSAASFATSAATPDNISSLLAKPDKIVAVTGIENPTGACVRTGTTDLERIRSNWQTANRGGGVAISSSHSAFNVAVEAPGDRRRGNPVRVGYGSTGDNA